MNQGLCINLDNIVNNYTYYQTLENENDKLRILIFELIVKLKYGNITNDIIGIIYSYL